MKRLISALSFWVLKIKKKKKNINKYKKKKRGKKLIEIRKLVLKET
jgi:hypothetical protein